MAKNVEVDSEHLSPHQTLFDRHWKLRSAASFGILRVARSNAWFQSNSFFAMKQFKSRLTSKSMSFKAHVCRETEAMAAEFPVSRMNIVPDLSTF